MSPIDWIDPNWRYELSNQILAWIVLGVLSAACFSAWRLIRRAVVDPPRTRMSLVIFILVGIVLGGALGAGLWLLLAQRQPTATANLSASSPAGQRQVPTLSVQYRDEQLPLTIPPLSSAYLVKLHLYQSSLSMEFRNDSNEPRLMPRPDSPKDDVLVCELTNVSTNSLVDVSVLFKTRYSEVEEVMFLKGSADQKVSVRPPLRPGEGYVEYYEEARGGIRGIKNAQPFFCRTHVAIIPFIRPSQTVVICVMNISTLFVHFDLPGCAKALAEHGGRVEHVFVRSAVNVGAILPSFFLPPPRRSQEA